MNNTTKPIFEVQGMKFRLKGTTRRNKLALERRMTEWDGEVTELQKRIEAGEAGIKVPDEFEENLELFRYLVDPIGDASFDKIDLDDFDVMVVEDAFRSFLPKLTTIFNALITS